MTRSPGAADGSLFSRPLMLITAITYRFFAPLLSAQFITADMGRPSVMRSLLPSPGGLLFPPMVARGGGGCGRVARLRRGRGDGRSRLAEVIPNFLSPSTSQRWHASAAHVADCARSVSRSGAPESDRGGGAPADRTGATSGRGGGVVSGGTPRRRSGQPARAIAKRSSLLGARSLTAAFAVKGSQSCSRQFKRYATNSFESRRRVAPLR